MTTPVLFLVFNRPDITRRTFSRLRETKPTQLFVAADGPRTHVPSDGENCRIVREIVQQVDWPCETHYLFRDTNLGCGQGVSSAISWFFEHVEHGIILEDDCYPSDDFFPFMDAVLKYHANNPRIMMISGNNFQQGKRHTPYSYFFSRACHIWGWATWRRAWQHYDFNMMHYPQFRNDHVLENLFDSPSAAAHWQSIFDKMLRKEIDTWDYQWVFTVLSQDGLAVYPESNLVSNIGFGEDATHTTDAQHSLANMSTHSIGQILHPPFIFPNREADAFTADQFFKGKPSRAQRRLEGKVAYRLLKKLLSFYEQKVSTEQQAP